MAVSGKLNIILILLLILPVTVLTDEHSDEQHLEMIEEKNDVDDSIEKGLKWLVGQQDVTFGFFRGRLKYTYTGLSCIALMASGHFPGRSKYGENLRKGILYLAKEAVKNNGYLGGDGGRMYGHGICTLALTEAYGMLNYDKENKKIREGLDAALKLILGSQVRNRNTHFGGWRYQPNSKDSDLSITVWQVLALRSAQNCQLAVPDQAIKDALDYVRKSFSPRVPGFTYQPGNHGNSNSMRSAGVVCMLALGADKNKDDKEKITRSAEFLLTVDPNKSKRHFFYQSYYLATAANMMGEKYRNKLLPKLERLLIRLQNKSGDFQKNGGYDGGVYSTAFAIICLAVRYQYLPIYQE